ncbi:hypothetical protein PYCCODRAFT_1433178 [Trametes coccinea BRFM310]|uniref:Uncharacterized protein n=1 Tax=Trametes coccinea (strain BRFM310) TaxID=1353009 RepID=A0A1Y2IUM3_TRAC3|nr:hypothetical protein PYCCODRAFT_1433178 [Trametes coccinea BRFM310]
MAAQAAVEAYLARTGATMDFIAFAACIPTGTWGESEEEVLLDVPTDSGPLPGAVKANMGPRTPSPKAKDVSASPESDYRSDSTKSSWGSLASASPPQEMGHEPSCALCVEPSYLALERDAENKGDLHKGSNLPEDGLLPAFTAGLGIHDED